MAFKHTACFVITVMIVCNAVLYPSIFSTIFKQWFGSTAKKETPAAKEPASSSSHDLPPHMRGRGMGPNPRRREINPHKTADASASSFFAGNKQGGGDGGRGRGLMGSILPVYAVGILMYFAYIMYKIFLKDKAPETTNQESTPQKSFNEFQTQYGPTLERRKAEELQRTLSDELKGAKKKAAAAVAEAKATKFKVAASKAGDDDSEVDVVALQKRLEDTEKAMQRMMDMMNNMGVAMNQVTKQLCENKDDDPGQQADDEVSDEGEDPLSPPIYQPLSTHSTDTEEEDISNVEVMDRVPRGEVDADEDSAKCDDDEEEEEEEEEFVENIGMDSKENDATDTVRRRNVGSTDGETVQ